MEIEKVTKLLNQYKECPDCGNKYVGNGQGTLIVDDDTFYRSCKCGFQVKTRDDGGVVDE